MEAVRQNVNIKCSVMLELEWTVAANDINLCSNDNNLAGAINEMSESSTQFEFNLVFCGVALNDPVARENSHSPLLELFNSAIVVEDGFATFGKKSCPPLEWAPIVKCIYIQEWYKKFIATLHAEWTTPDEEIIASGVRMHVANECVGDACNKVGISQVLQPMFSSVRTNVH